jgi:hypothetical protein
MGFLCVCAADLAVRGHKEPAKLRVRLWGGLLEILQGLRKFSGL